MKIDKLIIAAALTALISLEAWTLKEVVNLKVQVAALTVRIETVRIAKAP